MNRKRKYWKPRPVAFALLAAFVFLTIVNIAIFFKWSADRHQWVLFAPAVLSAIAACVSAFVAWLAWETSREQTLVSQWVAIRSGAVPIGVYREKRDGEIRFRIVNESPTNVRIVQCFCKDVKYWVMSVPSEPGTGRQTHFSQWEEFFSDWAVERDDETSFDLTPYLLDQLPLENKWGTDLKLGITGKLGVRVRASAFNCPSVAYCTFEIHVPFPADPAYPVGSDSAKT